MKRSSVYLLALCLTFVAASSCGDDPDPAPKPDASAYGGKGTCGNGKVEGTELCDGDDLNQETCATIGDGLYTKGDLACTDKCVFDVSMCYGEDSGMRDMDGGGGGTGG